LKQETDMQLLKPRLAASPAGSPKRNFWQGLSQRERAIIALAVLVIGVAVLWSLLLAPAFNSLRDAAQERVKLNAQAQHMHDLARQAAALKALPQIRSADAQHTLRTATEQRLGKAARLTTQGSRATINLSRVNATQFAAWLADVRANARATVLEMRLTREVSNQGASPTTGSPTLWSGVIALTLPL
jgi:general secretion pathway protein M